MEEKRNYHRIKLNVPMRYFVPPTAKEFVATTWDVSGTGLSFDTPEELKVRQELLIYLSLNNEQEPIEMHAKVVRVEKGLEQTQNFRVGVRIADDIKFDEREYVKFYADHLK